MRRRRISVKFLLCSTKKTTLGKANLHPGVCTPEAAIKEKHMEKLMKSKDPDHLAVQILWAKCGLLFFLKTC